MSDEQATVLTDKVVEEMRFDIKNTKPTSSLTGLFRQHTEDLPSGRDALLKGKDM